MYSIATTEALNPAVAVPLQLVALCLLSIAAVILWRVDRADLRREKERSERRNH
ncbi:hypothetical protein [Microbacterium sp. W4I20]|uniref:hypothetical protein n=1 Tax=Microbacterium sp. W4I20 TaxID=3042262 RepID=UPI00278A8A8C|nr:hypothetical protein [Microbacterium sp. W4I20]MDQ0727131.1 membrane protein implicated in regulation of membrane protease activity [Microbacterium sp. W4I20]